MKIGFAVNVEAEELVGFGLTTPDGKRLTELGIKVCKSLESLGPIISMTKFLGIVEELRSKDRRWSPFRL